jgi:hypothetical protein
MNAATISNAKPPRKQLSDQLDRLDCILDVLSDGLNGAVAEAAREGTRLAVRDAIVQLMTDSTLRAKLHQATAPETPADPVEADDKPRFWRRVKAYAGQVVESVGRIASNAMIAIKDKAKALTQAAAETARSVRDDLGTLKSTVLVVGVTMAIGSYLAPHAASAAVAGMSSAIAVIAIRLGLWLGRTRRALFIA